MADVGMKAIGDGLFHLSTDSIVLGLQASDVELFRWSGAASAPVVPAGATMWNG